MLNYIQNAAINNWRIIRTLSCALHTLATSSYQVFIKCSRFTRKTCGGQNWTAANSNYPTKLSPTRFPSRAKRKGHYHQRL